MFRTRENQAVSTANRKRVMCDAAQRIALSLMALLMSFALVACESDPNSGSSQSASSSSSIAATVSSSSASSSSQDEASVTVHVTVDSSAAESAGYSSTMADTDVTLTSDASAYDALVATGLPLEGTSDYVTAIDGLASGQISATSGWMYSVDDETPMVAANEFQLGNGMSVRWYYVV